MLLTKQLVQSTCAAKAACVALLCAASLGVSSADWTPVDPGGGGWCYGIYPHPTNPDIVFVNTDISGLFKSIDGGTTYTVKSNGMHVNTGGGSVVGGTNTQFAFDPASPNTCYYAAHFFGRVHNNGLWKSIDCGETWAFVTGSDSLYGASIAVDFNGVLYCAQQASSNVWVSSNKGGSFSTKSTLPFTLPSAVTSYTSSIRIVASKSNRLYVADPTSASGMYYSDNQGDSWTPVSALSGLTIGAGSPRASLIPARTNAAHSASRGAINYNQSSSAAMRLLSRQSQMRRKV